MAQFFLAVPFLEKNIRHVMCLYQHASMGGIPHTTFLNPRSRVLLENLTVTQAVKNTRAFYETQRFITVSRIEHKH
jgi:hypothetical protein